MERAIIYILGAIVTGIIWYQSDTKHDWRGKLACEEQLPRNQECIWAAPEMIAKE